jgi:hypothetical protein
MKAIFELCDKSKIVHGKFSTKSVLLEHISCIDKDIHLKNISISKSAWQFSVYVFGHTFTASSEAFHPTDDELKSRYLKEVQKTLEDLLKVWNQIHNKQVSQKHAHCPN